MALAEDRDALLASPALLEYALNGVRKPDHQAVPLTDLKKKVAKPLQAAFEAAVVARVAAGAPLSPAVGRLYVKKKPHFFLLCDVGASPASGGRQPPDFAASSATLSNHQGADAPGSPGAADFAAAFDEAFDRLDRQKGSHNLVSLLDLRPAVAAARAAFDAGLQQLRRAGRYTLSTAEGRHGVRPRSATPASSRKARSCCSSRKGPDPIRKPVALTARPMSLSMSLMRRSASYPPPLAEFPAPPPGRHGSESSSGRSGRGRPAPR